MKHFSSKRSFYKVFLGSVVLTFASAIVFSSCKKEAEDFNTFEQLKVKPLTEKNVPKVEDIDLSKNEDSDKRSIYLTFDDGPNRGTKNLMTILNKHQVVATSFVVGKHIVGSQKQMDDFYDLQQDSLIEIANHSYSHANNKYSKFYRNPEVVVQDFKILRDSLKLLNPIARTPGRNIWRINGVTATDIKSSTKAADELQSAGFKLVGWDLEWRATADMKLKNNHAEMIKKVDSIFYNDLEKTPRHLVLLTHDQYLDDEISIKELDLFIQKLQKSQRFVFKKISEYPKINEILN